MKIDIPEQKQCKACPFANREVDRCVLYDCVNQVYRGIRITKYLVGEGRPTKCPFVSVVVT